MEKGYEQGSEDSSMKEIAVIGTGMGDPGNFTEEGLMRLSQAELLLGAERMLNAAKQALQEKAGGGGVFREEVCYEAQPLMQKIREAKEERIAVLFSGDTGFYSGAQALLALLSEEGYAVRVCPGISSLSMLCARLGFSWEQVHVCSLHGRGANAAYAVKTHPKTFFLTDGRVGPLARRLTMYGLGETLLHIGYRLSDREERIVHVKAEEFALDEETPELCCVLAENQAAEPLPVYLPDGIFHRREGIPMSKELVRTLAASFFPVGPGAVLYDVGSGTGSVSAALAVRVPEGAVYAIEQEADAVSLTEENARALSMDQIICVHGQVPEVFPSLPAPAGVFVGGSGGKLCDILEAVPGGHFFFAAAAVTLETLEQMLILEKRAEVSDLCMCQIAVTQVREKGRYHMQQAQNPVCLATGRWDKI